MKTRLSPGLLAISAAAVVVSSAPAVVVTQWNFNGATANTVPGGSLAPTPSTGSGIASLVGGTTADPAFGSGTNNGGSSDPAPGTPPDFAWQTTTYPAQGAGNKTAGTQYLVSTAGFQNITLNYDLRHSNTSSAFEQVQYTLDGSTWLDIMSFSGPAGDTWFNSRSVDLSSIAGANNNANFGVRVVSMFDPAGGTGYLASNSPTSPYAGGGTWRFDMVTINGTAIPAPGALALLGVAGIVAGRRRRSSV